MPEIRLALLGPEIEHHDSLQTAWGAACKTNRLVPWVPDSHTFRRQQHRHAAASVTTQLARKLEPLLWGTRDRSYLDFVLQKLDENSTQVLLTYWGTMPLADVLALRRARPKLKIILLTLCYPLALTTLGVWRQRLAVWRAAGALDGVICPTPEMQRYLQTHDLRGQKHIHFGVVPPCWPLSSQAQERSASIASNPNVIYTGRTDISGHAAHAADDLRPLLHDLLDAGIEVHHASAQEVDDDHPLRRPFASMSLPELIQKMSAYDASLIAYNTAACQRVERFTFTVPDRLISSVCAGVPIAIPAKGYEASKTYLSNYHPAVLTFSSPQDLKNQLSDRAHVQALRDAAWSLRKNYCAEAQGDRLLSVVQHVMSE